MPTSRTNPCFCPPDLQEWVPPGHLAHHVSDVVDALDLTAFYAPYVGDGRRNAPYEPSMMVKVLIYAYATGTFSSRAVARKLEEDVAFRMLAAGNFPQHRTVCEFRRRHLAEFSELFVGVVQVAREMGLARFGKLSVDGTKVRANASKRKAMSYERMGKEAARLQAEIEALLKVRLLEQLCPEHFDCGAEQPGEDFFLRPAVDSVELSHDRILGTGLMQERSAGGFLSRQFFSWRPGKPCHRCTGRSELQLRGRPLHIDPLLPVRPPTEMMNLPIAPLVQSVCDDAHTVVSELKFPLLVIDDHL